VPERAVDSADREASRELGADVAIVVHVGQDRGEQARAQTRVEREARSVHEHVLVARDPEPVEVGADRLEALRGRSGKTVHLGADRLEDVLGHEVVGLLHHLSDEGAER
jgi:hypothetical protein